MTNQLFRDYLDGREPLPSWRANFLHGITGPNRIAIRTTGPLLLALHARDHRNTGPKLPNLTQRGRITKYKTKG